MTSSRIKSALFTPGTEAARMRKAVSTGADACIFDLEDSVPPPRVAEARELVRGALEELEGQSRIWLRVHPVSSPMMIEDLAALPLAKAAGVVLPKVSDWSDVVACRKAMKETSAPAELPVLPIIESAVGVLNAAEIAEETGVFCLAFGRFDLSADLGIDPDGGSPALAAAKAAIVLASATHALHPPLDSPWLQIKDLDGLRGAAQRARADGFGGMLLIHPSHVAVVNEVFSPTRDEIAWARDIVGSADQALADGRGVYARDGAMVDEAIIRRARAILEEIGGTA